MITTNGNYTSYSKLYSIRRCIVVVSHIHNYAHLFQPRYVEKVKSYNNYVSKYDYHYDGTANLGSLIPNNTPKQINFNFIYL